MKFLRENIIHISLFILIVLFPLTKVALLECSPGLYMLKLQTTIDLFLFFILNGLLAFFPFVLLTESGIHRSFFAITLIEIYIILRGVILLWTEGHESYWFSMTNFLNTFFVIALFVGVLLYWMGDIILIKIKKN